MNLLSVVNRINRNATFQATKMQLKSNQKL